MSAAVIEKPLTAKQAAERLGVTPAVVRGLCRNGSLKAFDVTRNAGTGRARYRIRPEEVERFIEGRSSAPAVKEDPAPRRRPAGVREFYPDK